MFEKFGMSPVKKEQKEKFEKLPDFLHEENGKIMTTTEGDTDVRGEYENFLKVTGKSAESLPPFLYRAGSSIIIGLESGVDVTNSWRNWVKTLKSAKTEEGK
ncbi:MAG: hypothetical protein HYX21_01100 [Candidatus Yanofskybacteria bacterium]|nr:hypothetical protein [Candidatus Yanofskybacteria bacterium]